MMRRRLKRHALKPALSRAVRMFVVFALAFYGTYGVQAALADDAVAPGSGTARLSAQDDAAGGDAGQGDGTQPGSQEEGGGQAGEGGGSAAGPDAQPPVQPDPQLDEQPDVQPDAQPDVQPDPAPETDPTPEPSPDVRITDLGLYEKPDGVEGIKVLSYATAGVPDQHAEITESGGSMDLDVLALWNDGSTDYDYGHVSWRLDDADAQLASIDPRTGLVRSIGGKDGTVTVTASLDGAYAEKAEQREVKLLVDLKGQEGKPYVETIVVCDEAGVPIEPAYTFHDADLATATVELQAAVTVVDPVTGEKTVYQVKPGAGLSSQTGGVLADLTWYSTESSFGAISDDGIYRPLREASNVVYAVSHAGLGGTDVSGSATIVMPGEGGEAHPQDSLTVDIVWEAYPDQVVGSKTFSVGDMEALGTHLVTYTAFGGGTFGFMTFTGRGPYLADVLEAAGVDTTAVKELRMESFDNPYVVSWGLLVGKDRYYFPNMDIGSEAEAVQVAPMLAIESLRAPLGTSEPVDADKLTSDDRFRLLFGAGIGDEGFTTTSMQRYWIHTIHVVLAGAPPAEPDEPEPEPEPEPTPGVVPGGPTSAGGGGGDASQPATAGQGDSPDAQAQTGSAQKQGRNNAGAWSVLQAVNRNDSDVEGVDFDNPFGPLTNALGVGFLAAGGAEAYVSFRRQKRIPDLGEAW